MAGLNKYMQKPQDSLWEDIRPQNQPNATHSTTTFCKRHDKNVQKLKYLSHYFLPQTILDPIYFIQIQTYLGL